MVSMIIRDATHADLGAILEIHNAAIRDSLAIWTEEEADLADREAWLADHEAVGHPVLVAEVEGRVAGYAAYGPWRSKTGYRFTVENSVYVHDDFQRRGIGRALMVELIERARAAGIHVMVAAIEAGNAGSIAMHRALGFEEPVVLREVGTKFGQWLDVAFLRLELSSGPPM
ncbi:GNAT family N-acetyltransferase [Salinibacterium soli]|uniref:N-acetyltransferase family protein n=1 Tax=Antiquaquibacter soli TaxID=3064523 RepID=A0ABT9BQM2_9MICO|nr:GNAT family N-acetyltransferase [Protaetiibacter sp. WY-16]MDO7883318.1 N-acetyltransferase family protein [Protaetiibacter sp. WY-16]